MSRTAPRCAALALLIAVVVSPATSADPAGSDFTIEPLAPEVGETVTFTFQPGPDIDGEATVEWDVRGNDSFDETGPSATQSYDEPGEVTVRMQVTDDDGSVIVPKTFTVAGTAVVNAPPVVSFDFTPASPLPGQEVWFDGLVSDPDGDSVTLAWNFGEGEGTASVEDPRHTYMTPGPRTVTLTATDEHGLATTETRQLIVQDPAGPTASFSFAPAVPLVGQVVTFSNTSTASSGSITAEAWDLDNDGEFDDPPAAWSFATPGAHVVALRVTQTNGNAAVTEQTVRVNAPPSAGFVWSPLSPVAGQPTDLISISTDSEGPLAAQEWDLDGDGQFDDAGGPAVSHAFPAAGTYDVGVRVTDSDGVTALSRHAVVVSAVVVSAPPLAAPPAAAPVTPPSTGVDEPEFIAPFPVVRLAGEVLPRAAHVQVLAVRAPRGAAIRVTCTGAGCPVGAARRTSRGRSVRFAMFERRLRAGIRLGISVRQAGRIGKFTRFVIRAGKAPARTDLCLFPGRVRPVRCP